MSKRLLSIRRRKHADEPVQPTVTAPEYFDFDFRVGQTPVIQPDITINDGRPKTSGHDGHRTQLVDRPNARPRSASGPFVMTPKDIAAIRAEDYRIGLALGSPTNPPPGWSSQLASIDQTMQRSNTSEPRPQSRWRKMSQRLRSRSNTNTTTTQYTIHKIDSVCRGRTDGLVHPPRYFEQHSVSKKEPNPTTPEISQQPPNDGLNIVREQSAHEKFPLLAIEIPSTQMERYSVMFNGISGIEPSSLLSRRSKAVAELRTLYPRKSRDLPPLPTPRRVTSPMTKPGYSLFPPQTDLRPNSRDSALRVDTSGRQTVVRPMSSPARLSPFRMNEFPAPADTSIQSVSEIRRKPLVFTSDRSEKSKAELVEGTAASVVQAPGQNGRCHDWHDLLGMASNLNPRPISKGYSASVTDVPRVENVDAQACHSGDSPSSDLLSSPEDNARRRKKDDAPWISRPSLESLASSKSSVNDEIFFGIASCKDSKEELESIFAISRPDSAAVQLARAVSKKAKQDRAEQNEADMTGPTIVDMPPDLQAAEHRRMNSTDSSHGYPVRHSVIDKAIAEVERLAAQQVPAMPPPVANQQTLGPTIGVNLTKSQAKPPSQFRGLAIGIPSPIMERSEECTPITAPGQSLSPRSRRISGQTSPVPSRISQPPPPVPEKDSKFIPTSKFITPCASNNTSSRKQPPSSPPPPLTRSLADPLQPYSVPPTTPSTPFNPTTFSARAGAAIHFPPSSSTPTLTTETTPTLELNPTSIIAVAINPAPEVSVARTISLRRKPSHQVLVSRSASSAIPTTTSVSLGRLRR